MAPDATSERVCCTMTRTSRLASARAPHRSKGCIFWLGSSETTGVPAAPAVGATPVSPTTSPPPNEGEPSGECAAVALDPSTEVLLQRVRPRRVVGYPRFEGWSGERLWRAGGPGPRHPRRGHSVLTAFG